jgi:hypothetical protein
MRVANEPFESAGDVRAGGHTLPDLRPPGEMIDRLVILKRKIVKHSDPVLKELSLAEARVLERDWRAAGLGNPVDVAEYETLHHLNELIWHAEDETRRCERDQDFGHEFFEHIRTCHTLNRRRAEARRRIDENLRGRLRNSLIETESGLDHFLDRMTIGQVMLVRRPGTKSQCWRQWRELWLAAGLADCTQPRTSVVCARHTIASGRSKTNLTSGLTAGTRGIRALRPLDAASI